MNGWVLFFTFGALGSLVAAFLWIAAGQYALAALVSFSALANAYFAGRECSR